jgi:hypothetical protein
LGQIRLPSLEEYAVAYWIHQALTGVRLNPSTWCWLRAYFGLGALLANDNAGQLHVSWFGAEDLASSFEVGGGRAVEPVESLPLAA